MRLPVFTMLLLGGIHAQAENNTVLSITNLMNYDWPAIYEVTTHALINLKKTDVNAVSQAFVDAAVTAGSDQAYLTGGNSGTQSTSVALHNWSRVLETLITPLTPIFPDLLPFVNNVMLYTKLVDSEHTSEGLFPLLIQHGLEKSTTLNHVLNSMLHTQKTPQQAHDTTGSAKPLVNTTPDYVTMPQLMNAVREVAQDLEQRLSSKPDDCPLPSSREGVSFDMSKDGFISASGIPVAALSGGGVNHLLMQPIVIHNGNDIHDTRTPDPIQTQSSARSNTASENRFNLWPSLHHGGSLVKALMDRKNSFLYSPYSTESASGEGRTSNPDYGRHDQIQPQQDSIADRNEGLLPNVVQELANDMSTVIMEIPVIGPSIMLAKHAVDAGVQVIENGLRS